MRYVLEKYVIEDMWKKIKTYMVHDIKTQSKHLRNAKEIRRYNMVIRDLPRICASDGPCIIYYTTRVCATTPLLNVFFSRAHWKTGRTGLVMAKFLYNVKNPSYYAKRPHQRAPGIHWPYKTRNIIEHTLAFKARPSTGRPSLVERVRMPWIDHFRALKEYRENIRAA